MKLYFIVIAVILLAEGITKPSVAIGVPDCTDDPYGGSQGCCGSYFMQTYPVDCASHGDTNSFCVYSHHCSCSNGYECPDSGKSVECASGLVCVPKCDGSDCICGSNDNSVDCSAHGDTESFCVFNDHCSCSMGFQCPSASDVSTLIEGGECHPGYKCTPIPPNVIVSDLIIKGGNGNKDQYLDNVTDGDLTTYGTMNKIKKPWVSVMVSKNLVAAKWSVTVTPPQDKKKKKKLAGFEIWTGTEAGSLLVKCGGPYSKKKLRKSSSITAVCDKGQANFGQQNYITITIPNKKKKKTKIEIAELSVSQYTL